MDLLLSPVVYSIPAIDPDALGGQAGYPYPANCLEYTGQAILDVCSFVLRLLYHLPPFCLLAVSFFGPAWMLFLFDSTERAAASALLATVALAAVSMAAIVIRALGRTCNEFYRDFIMVHSSSLAAWSKEAKLRLSAYDFDFGAWPVEFTATNARQYAYRPQRLFVSYPLQVVVHSFMVAFVLATLATGYADGQPGSGVFAWPGGQALKCAMNTYSLIYLIVCKFGIYFIYFGAAQGSQHQLGSYYSKQRNKLIFRRGGERFKLRTDDGNDIDSMFFDRRRFISLQLLSCLRTLSIKNFSL